jgi:leader peptidase (prepilin peptidase)/N-methyltransferase
MYRVGRLIFYAHTSIQSGKKDVCRATPILGDMLNGPYVIELPAFLLGLLFGSFLNVCISRLPEHRSISAPRSQCPHCQTPIVWYDNIPLLSWILLRARCRGCGGAISWRYPAVELGYGCWLGFVAHNARALLVPGITTNAFGRGCVETVSLAVLGFLLIGLAVMDWQTYTLPDVFTITGIVVAFVLTCCSAFFLGPHVDEVLLHGQNPLSSPGNVVDRGNVVLTGPEHLVLGRMFAIVCAGGIVLSVRYIYRQLRRREGVGLGDVKLVAMIAAFLGFWPAVLALFMGVVLSSMYAVPQLLRGRATATTRLPFGTFLSMGGLIAAVTGAHLIAWYSSLL